MLFFFYSVFYLWTTVSSYYKLTFRACSICMIQSPKSSNLNFYIRQGLSRLVLQPKFLFDQGRAAVALVVEMYFTDWEMSPRH